MTTKRSILRCLFAMLLFTTLSGCGSLADTAGAAACLTGLCPTTEKRLASIPWSPAALQEGTCPAISGIYQDIEGTRKTSLWGRIDYLSGINRGTSRKLEEIPYVWSVKPTRYRHGPQLVDDVSMQKDESGFYRHARTSIRQGDNSMTAVLMDKNGVAYRKSTLFLDRRLVGCHGGDFIVRKAWTLGGSEGATKSVQAIEWRFTKLKDGSLRLTSSQRTWAYSTLWGISGDPKTEETVLLYQGS